MGEVESWCRLCPRCFRVDYPRFCQLGLPVTLTLLKSLVKESNLRVEGTEEFWNDPNGTEDILTVCAALLSEDNRFNDLFADRPDCRRSTWKKSYKQSEDVGKTDMN